MSNGSFESLKCPRRFESLKCPYCGEVLIPISVESDECWISGWTCNCEEIKKWENEQR